MTIYSMRFFWKPGEEGPSRAGPMNLQATNESDALLEARRVWEGQPFIHGPKGYRIYDNATGDLVYEHERAN
jgi:hypothetical protein